MANYLVEGQPDECLVRVVSYLLERGYSLDDRVGESVTLARSPEIELNSPLGCVIGIGAFFSMGLLLSLLLLAIAAGVWKWKATLVALPTQDGRTLLSTGGSNKKVEETLVVMVRDVFVFQGVPTQGS